MNEVLILEISFKDADGESVVEKLLKLNPDTFITLMDFYVMPADKRSIKGKKKNGLIVGKIHRFDIIYVKSK